MKIRNGFVSNSSSSSFVVPNKNVFFGKGKKSFRHYCLTKKQISILKGTGFVEIASASPSIVLDSPSIKSMRPATPKDSCFAMAVSCNQEDIIYFLLKNGLPFISACHYAHYTVYYNPRLDKKNFWTFRNYGLEVEMYDFESMKDMWDMDMVNDKPIERKSVKKFVKDNARYMERNTIEEDTIILGKKKRKKK